METLGIVVLVVVLVVLLSRGSSADGRIARLEREREELRDGLKQAYGRIAHLEQGMNEAWRWLQGLRAEQVQLLARPPQAPVPPAGPVVEPALAPPLASPEPQPHTQRQPEAAPPEPPSPAEPAPAEATPGPPPVAEPAPVPAEPTAVPVAAEPPRLDTEPAPEGAAPVIAPAPPVPIRPDAPPPAASPLGPAPPSARPDWERWVGVRGAAALGACVLVVAGLYFFKYSLEQGLISPTLRVILGTLVGLGALAASELKLRRDYTVLANWLAGAGIAILYTAFWAAHGVYGLLGSAPSFALMILVTVACGLLAHRHDALVIALLGLLGGFVTPFALSSGEDHPFGLFGYLLLLDGALLYLAARKRWPWLGALSLLGTALYQMAWIGARMGPERPGLGMAIVVVFGGVYAWALPAPGKDEQEAWKLTRAATVSLPFAFGLYFGLRSDLGEHLYPLGLMLAIVSAGAAWMARLRRSGWIGLGPSVGTVSVVGAWLVVHDRAAIAGEIAGVAALLGAVYHGFFELERLRPRPDGDGGAAAGRAAGVASLGTLSLLIASAAAPSSHDPWPWLAGELALGALALRQSFMGRRSALRLGVGLLVSLGFPLIHLFHADDPLFPASRVFLTGVLVVTGLGLLSAALLRGGVGASRDDTDAPELPGGGADELAALLPFAFGLYFASCAEIGPHLLPLALLLLATAAGAAWASRGRPASAWIALASAVCGVVVLGTWLLRHEPVGLAWEIAGLVALLPITFHAFTELPADASEPAGMGWIARAAAVAALGAIFLLFGAAVGPRALDPWPWIGAALLVGALVFRQAGAPGREPLHVVVAVELGVGLESVHAAHAGEPLFPSGAVFLAVLLAAALAVQGAAQAYRPGAARRWASHGAAALALLLLVDALQSPVAPAPSAFVLLGTLALLALALISATRLAHGGWAFAAVLAGAFVHTGYTLLHVTSRTADPAVVMVLAGQALTLLLFAAWPLVASRRFQGDAWAWRAAALAGPLWSAALYHAWTTLFGSGAIGLLPLGLGLVAGGAGLRARSVLPAQGEVRTSALVWLFAVALCAVSVAIPLQLDDEWITVGWALEGLALAALWRRMDHAGLKYTALAHLAAVSVRLVANPWVLEYHARSSVPVVNWLMYTYWIPTACLLGAWYLLRPLEVPRKRPWESGFYDTDQPVFAIACAASAIVVFFAWINLTIFDAFGQGSALQLDFARLPARDLTFSLAWAIYALVLLGTGMARGSAGLRWTSLALIIVTVGKVFLYDLSHLHDLYRVMSLVGLAFSLILISLAYQRFVFGRRDKDAP